MNTADSTHPDFRSPRLVRVSILLGWSAAAAVATAVAIFVTREFWRDQLAAWYIGSIELAALNYGSGLGTVDEVQIVLLGTNSVAKGNDSFPSDPGRHLPILSTRTLKGPEAERFAERWRQLRFSYSLAALCHDPGHGLRFLKGGKVLFESSLCLKCKDFTVPVLWGHALCGFDAENSMGQAFVSAVLKEMPLPPERALPSRTQGMN